MTRSVDGPNTDARIVRTAGIPTLMTAATGARQDRATSCTARRGVVHGFRNESGAPVAMLILVAPAPPRERYVRELGERIASGRTDSDEGAPAEHDQHEV